MNKTSIIIADDHPVVLSGLRYELSSLDYLTVVEEACNGVQAMQLIKKLHPNIAILDFQMPGMTGLEIAEQLIQSKSQTKVILLTMYRDRGLIFRVFDLGINGLVLKDDAVIDLITAVNKVIEGKSFFSESLFKVVLERSKQAEQANQILKQITYLTTIERKIVQLVGELKSNEEISSQLFISKRTVENHKVKIADKLQLNSSRELLKFILENKNYF